MPVVAQRVTETPGNQQLASLPQVDDDDDDDRSTAAVLATAYSLQRRRTYRPVDAATHHHPAV
jgi:hypothetical protein